MRIARPLLALAAAFAFAFALPAVAQSKFPSRTVSLVVPYPAGGSNDIFARALGKKLAEAWGQPVIVENKPGAGGSIGAAFVSNAAPDGYTIMLLSSSFTTSAAIQPKLPFDPVKGFTPIAMVARGPMVLTVSNGVPAKTFAEFLALAKSKPGKLNFGSSGIGNSIHLAAEQFNADVGIQAVHVPYKTGPETDAAIMAGDVHYAWQSVPSSIALLTSGRTKGLAVTGDSRDPALPNVPSLKEAGYNVLLPDQLFGMVAPANLPAPVLAKLNQAVQAMTADPEFQAIVRKGGGTPSQVGGDEFAKIVQRDSKLWGDLIKRLNITPT